ncbi:hypothetical protein EDC01DRAFT_89639 [Geopyxis carbonaria]|nr:hypothetical protein EDC01DRAFT_89639 [Geopyxis carbonaria]
MDQHIDYDSCAQFLARLDSDAEHAPAPAPASAADRTSQLSPAALAGDSAFAAFDTRNSQSPPGLSSGSATSHSPESLRFDWDPTDPAALFAGIAADPSGLVGSGDTWDPLIVPSPDPRHPHSAQVISPMSDYIKIENDSSPGGYFSPQGGAQGTISPGNSLIDPTAQTALEGSFSFGGQKENDGLFDFNGYADHGSRQNSGDFSPLLWGNQAQQRDDFNASWQQPPPPQQQQQQIPPPPQQIQQLQQQQQQQQIPQQQQIHRRHQSNAQLASPLRNSLSPSANSPSSPDSRAESYSGDEANAAAPAPRTKKRKTSTDDMSPNDGTQPATNGRKQPKKTAHNMIEKRYRTNLNDKIAALRDSVPSLRIMAGTSKLGDDDEEEDLEGLAPAHKLNKATVLAKATEYIRHLEKRNKRLQDENDQLKNRLSAFEKLATMGGNLNLQQQQGPPGGHNGQGGPGGGLMSRLMVGSLAGLMVANGFQEHETGNRQLFGVPVGALQWLGVSNSPTVQAGNHMFWLIAKISLLFFAIAYVITPGFFDRKPASENAKAGARNANIVAAPSLASPLKDRSHAWLTAIQTVWVPRHSVALELAALGLKAVKLGMRRLIGWERYRWITGMTEEQEQARIKSWAIALDAQLAGGDVSLNHSRLLLTLLASWTLPATPARLMLNSLHIRVLFADLPGLHSFAEMLSNYYWAEARKLQETPRPTSPADEASTETLPENLARLLQLDAAEVFDPLIVQKAHDLAYNRSTTSEYDGFDEGFGSVVKDVSIRSPLDALAAWYSSLVLHGAFIACLKAKTSPAVEASIQTDLRTALETAPITSAAHLRALAANGVLKADNPEAHLFEAKRIFDEDTQTTPSPAAPSLASINSAVTTTPDIRIALRCGLALTLMQQGSRTEATRLFAELDWRRQSGPGPDALGLLGFVAAWKTLTTFVASDAGWADAAPECVDRAAASLRIWIGDRRIPKAAGVARDDCKRIIGFCNALQRRLAGLDADGDDGYVSGSAQAAETKHVQLLRPVPDL